MASYELVFKRSVAKDLRAFPSADVKRILQRIRAIANAHAHDPRPTGCEKLSGQDRYRVRQGAYRIVYEIEDSRLVVLVIRIGHGRDVYRS